MNNSSLNIVAASGWQACTDEGVSKADVHTAARTLEVFLIEKND